MNFKEYLEENTYNDNYLKRNLGMNPTNKQVMDFIIKKFKGIEDGDQHKYNMVFRISDHYGLKPLDVVKALRNT